MRNCVAFVLALSATPALAGKVFDPNNPDPPPEQTTQQICASAIQQKRTELAARGVDLGSLITTQFRIHPGQWCSQGFTKGRVHTAAPTRGATAAIHGAISTKYALLGGETSGFGRAYGDAVVLDGGVTRQHFARGYILAHPSFGVRAISFPLGVLWAENASRFGYPTSDELANPFGTGSYSRLERGYVARTTEMGEWIDFTGAGEGRVAATVKLYADAGLPTTAAMIERALYPESPVALRPQFGALEGLTSSLRVNMPTRTSLYLYDLSPADGRYVRITGADMSQVRITNIGSWMNDRASSMMFVNHGSVSSRTSLADLKEEIEDALDALDTDQLMRDALAGEYKTRGRLTWRSEVSVSVLPGERLIQVSRVGLTEIEKEDCLPGVSCGNEGEVLFTLALRPYVALTPVSAWGSTLRPTIHVQLVEGSAMSLSCQGEGCSERDAVLATMFDDLALRMTVEDMFDLAFDDKTNKLELLEALCPGVAVRRINLLPDSLEVVIGDTAEHASCAIREDLSDDGVRDLDAERPIARITNGAANPGLLSSFPPPWNGTYTVVPDFQYQGPPVLQ